MKQDISENNLVNVLLVNSERKLASLIEKQKVLTSNHRVVVSTTGTNLEDLIEVETAGVVIIDDSRLSEYHRIMEHVETNLTPTKVVIISQQPRKNLENEFEIPRNQTQDQSGDDIYGLACNIGSYGNDAINKLNAERDTLTSLLSRRLIFQKLTTAWRGITQQAHVSEEDEKRKLPLKQTPIKDLSVVYIDLDNLKNINEILSHEKGDDVIRCLADSIKTVFQRTKGDYSSRIGGEEYLLVLENTDPEYVRQKINDLQNNFYNSCCLTSDEFKKLGISRQTFSTGIVTYSIGNLDPEYQKTAEVIIDPSLLVLMAECGCKQAKDLKLKPGMIKYHAVDESLLREKTRSDLIEMFTYQRKNHKLE